MPGLRGRCSTGPRCDLPRTTPISNRWIEAQGTGGRICAAAGSTPSIKSITTELPSRGQLFLGETLPVFWRELYRKFPVRYASALGGKPWLPCLWRPMGFWEYQADLARNTGAGVSLSNGWMEYAGLSRLIPATRERILKDLAESTRLRASGSSPRIGI